MKAKIGVDKITNICLASEEPIVLVVKTGGKYKDVKAFIEAAKANEGDVSIGVPGAMNINEAYATILGKSAGVNFKFMPFSGGSRVITEILGDHVDSGVLKPSEIIDQVKAGKLTAIGIFNNDGLKELAGVPTFKSLGYDVFTYGNLRQVSFIMAPDKLGADEKASLEKMFKEAIESPEYQKFASASGMVAKPIVGHELQTTLVDISKSLDKVSKEIWTKK
jgi:tripartite-type tricarboxylate transporter receptor subunit TctC